MASALFWFGDIYLPLRVGRGAGGSGVERKCFPTFVPSAFLYGSTTTYFLPSLVSAIAGLLSSREKVRTGCDRTVRASVVHPLVHLCGRIGWTVTHALDGTNVLNRVNIGQ